MMDSLLARYLFPVALLPVPAWWQCPCFQSEYPHGQYLGPILPRLRAEDHIPGFGLGDHFRSGYFRFRWVQGSAPGANTTIDLLVGATKQTWFFHGESADFSGKYTKLHPELEITPNLITDQSTLINGDNGDFATKIRRFSTFLRGINGNANLETGIGNRLNTSSSSFPGVLRDNIYTRIGLYYQKCDCSRFPSGNCALNQTAGEFV